MAESDLSLSWNERKKLGCIGCVSKVNNYPFLATIESLGYEGGSVGYSRLPVFQYMSLWATQKVM